MRPDWSSRLYGVIENHRKREFIWGEHDCCLFVARCIDAMTGGDFESRILAEYADEDSAKQLILKHGGLQSAVTAYLGEPKQGRATRGDVVMVDGGEGDAMGICMGSQVACLGPKGLRYLKRDAIKAWWALG